MGAGYNKWWLLPVGIFVSSAMLSLNILVFGPSFFTKSPTEPVPLASAARTGASDGDRCSGALAGDYACHEERYEVLVRESGVEAAFVELKGEYRENGFIESNCHQMTHVIGRAAAELYGDVPSTYARGDAFCWSGYYHGAMEGIVAKIGPEKVMAQAGGICSDLGGNERYSFHHYNCAHGLGHGFMSLEANDLFASLDACDTLPDVWEADACYGGAFMENVAAGRENPLRPSTEFLDPERPLYPCTDVVFRHKEQCYAMQTSYALRVRGDDFVKVFELCATVEGAFRPTCYQSLGRDASGRSDNDPAKIEAACMVGAGYEARSNCIIGAARTFVSYYSDDGEAKSLCLSVEPHLQSACLTATDEYYATL